MRRKPVLMILALSLIIIASISFLFAFPLRAVFMSLVVTPLIHSFLVLRWYLHRLSQLVLWIIFVIAGAVVVLYALTRAFPPPKRRVRGRKYIFLSTATTSDLRRLTETIERAHRHPFSRRNIASKLVPLCVRLIAQRERIPLREARNRFESFKWCDDDAVRAFFNFRRQYHGVGRGRAFETRLRDVVSFLERYHQGV